MKSKKSARVSFKFTPELLAALTAEAQREDRSRNWMVAQLLEEALTARRRRGKRQ